MNGCGSIITVTYNKQISDRYYLYCCIDLTLQKELKKGLKQIINFLSFNVNKTKTFCFIFHFFTQRQSGERKRDRKKASKLDTKNNAGVCKN